MLTIRFSRIGKKNKPVFRIIISEKSKDPYGRALEILGSYNPHTKELQTKQERIEYWLSKGSGISPSVNNLLIEKGIIKGEKVKASKAGSKKKGESKEEKPAIKEEAKEEKPAIKEEIEEEAKRPENKKEEDKSSETKEQKDSSAKQEKSAKQKEDVQKNIETPKQ